MATTEQALRQRLLRARLQQARDRQSQVSASEGTVTTPLPVPTARPGLLANQSGRVSGDIPGVAPRTTSLSDENAAAAQGGVDVTTGAPVGRVSSGFAQNEAQQAQHIERLLTQHFGKPVTVRKGPQSGQLEFLNPETQRFTLVDEARVTIRDLLDLAGPSITAGAAAAGEVVGGPVGAAAGGAAGEAVRRGIGHAMGVREETAAEATRGVAAAGATEGAASVAGNVAMRAVQGARNLVRPQPVTAREAGRILTQSEAHQALADEISARTQMRLQPFTGQMADDPLLLGEQSRVLSSRESGVSAREQEQQNKTALEVFFDTVNPSGGGPRTAVGRSIQQEARSQTQPRVEAMEAGVQRQVAELESLTAALPRAQNQQMGAQLRQVAEEARQALKDSEDAAWDSVRRGYAFNPDTALSQYKVPVAGDLETTLRRLQTEAAEALDPAIASGKRQLATERLLPDDLAISDQHTIDLHQIQTLLQHLRKRERISRQNVVATDPGGRDISRVRDALVTQRNEYLKQVDPDLLAEIEGAEALTAARARLFDNGVVGGLLRKVDGQYVITDSDVVGRTIGSGNPEAISHLVRVLGSHPAGVPALQRSMLAYYRNEVVVDGIPKADLHRKFIDNHGEALDALFPSDMARIRELGEFEKVVTRNLKRFEDFETRVSGSATGGKPGHFRGRIQDLAPERVVEQLFSTQFSVKDVAMFVALAKQAGVDGLYQRAAGDQIRRRFISQTSGLNLNSLDKFIEQQGEKLYAVFGEGYIRDMRKLTQMMQVVQRDAGGIAVTKKPTLGEALARSTFARPLSAPGVALTRAMRFRQAAADRLLARAIMDPQALRDIVQQAQSDVTSRKVGQLLAVLGASSLATEEEGE